MLDPEYLLHISEGAEDIAEQLHSDIINRVVERMMIRMGNGEDYLLTSADKWRMQTLQDAGYLLEDIQAEIASKTKLQIEEIKEAMEEAGVKAISYDDKIYQSAGLSPTPLEQSPSLIRIMQRNYEATVGEWTNFTRTMANATQQNFITALDKAYTLVSTGTISYTEAVKEAVNTMIKSGAFVFYDSGRADSIETATLRAVRTGISQMSGQIQIARMDEMDMDLVLVSSHLGARPEHQEWQGKVYSRSGTSDKYPDFVQATGYGSVTGLCGANCRHNFGPYFEGMDNPFDDYDSEENLKAYEEQQRQRELERRIRSTKREVMGLRTAVENAKSDDLRLSLQEAYERKARLLKRQNNDYNVFCEEHNLKKLRDRISIARWDRKQAAKARSAARSEKTESFRKTLENSGKSSKIKIDELTPCLRRLRDGKLVDTGVFEISPTKNDFKDWEFDWTIPKKNGYKVYEIKAEGDYRTQGLIAMKPKRENRAMHVDIVEAAPFNNPHHKDFVQKQYNGVGGHLFAEAVKQSYEAGFDGAVYFTAKSDLIEHYHKELGAILINPRERTMFIDEKAAKVLYERYYGGK